MRIREEIEAPAWRGADRGRRNREPRGRRCAAHDHRRDLQVDPARAARARDHGLGDHLAGAAADRRRAPPRGRRPVDARARRRRERGRRARAGVQPDGERARRRRARGAQLPGAARGTRRGAHAAAAAPRRARSAHQPAEPPPALPAAERDDRGHRRRSRTARGAVPRPRQLQDRQRQPRPRVRRPGADEHRRATAPGERRSGLHRAAGRRRVHAGLPVLRLGRRDRAARGQPREPLPAADRRRPPRARDRRELRRRGLPRARARCGLAAARRRRRAVPRQGTGPQPPLRLRPGAADRRIEPLPRRAGAAQGDRGRRLRAAFPAAGLPRPSRDDHRRGAAALAAERLADRARRRLHRDRRAVRPDARSQLLGPRAGGAGGRATGAMPAGPMHGSRSTSRRSSSSRAISSPRSSGCSSASTCRPTASSSS